MILIVATAFGAGASRRNGAETSGACLHAAACWRGVGAYLPTRAASHCRTSAHEVEPRIRGFSDRDSGR